MNNDDERYIELIAEDIEETAEKELYEQRIIIFNDDVDWYSINVLIKKIMLLDYHNSDPITIFFNTDGGCEYESLQLYDFFRSLNSKINIHVGGRAFSAGVFIVACCATGTRTCGEHASFMYHPSHMVVGGNTVDVLSDSEEMKRLEDLMDGLLEKHTNLKDVTKSFSHNIWFDAKKAKKWGVIDEIERNKKWDKQKLI